MKKITNKYLRLGVPMIVVLVVVIAFVIPVEQQIKGPGRFIAKTEWTLVQIEQDKLQANLIRQGMKRNDRISLFHFNRPDYITVSLLPSITVGESLNAGDAVARLVSAEDEIRLAALRGELNEARANLAALNTGAKEAFRKEGEEALNYAITQFQAYEPILERQKTLYEKKLISRQELETSQAQYDMLKINVSLQKARLQAAETGEKAEQIAIIEAKVRSAAEQLDSFFKKLEAETITTPISGTIVEPQRSVGELVHICNMDTMIIQMPIKAAEVKYVEPGMSLKALIAGSKSQIIEAEILGVDRNARMINMQPMFIATAAIVNSGEEIYNGMSGYMKINAGRITVWTLLRRAWSNFHFNR